MSVAQTYLTFTAKSASGSNLDIKILDAIEAETLIPDPLNRWHGRANSFTLPRGKTPGHGWLLIPYRDLKQINRDSHDHQLEFVQNVAGTIRKITLQKLILCRAYGIQSTHQTDQDEAIYLIELQDTRKLCRMAGINTGYNVRNQSLDTSNTSYGAYIKSSTQAFYDNTTNGGTAWTWETMLTNIWDEMPSALSLAALNYTNAAYTDYTDDPENYSFYGTDAWDALHKVLNDSTRFLIPKPDTEDFSALVQTVTLNGTDYSIVDGGAIDTAYNNRYEKLKETHLLHSDNHLSNDICDIPEKYVICFPKFQYDFHNSSDNHDATPVDYYHTRPIHTVEVTTTSIDSSITTLTGSVKYIHDGMSARFGENGGAINSTELTDRATEVATNHIDRFNNSESSHRLFIGFHRFLPNTDISAVSWYLRDGAFTEVLHSPREFRPDGSRNGGFIPFTHTGRASVRTAEENPGPISRPDDPPLRWAVCKLTSTLVADGQADAIIRRGSYSPSTISWSDVSGRTVEVHDVSGLTGAINDQLLCYWHLQTGRWIVSTKGSGTGEINDLYIAYFKLRSDLYIGGETTADVLPCSDDVINEFGAIITVVDRIEKFKGRAGYFGAAYTYKSDVDTCDWTIIELQEQAEMIVATLSYDITQLTTYEATLSIKGDVAFADNYWQGLSPGATVTIAVVLQEHVGLKAGTDVIASYDEKRNHYVVIEPQRAINNVDEECVRTEGRGDLEGGILLEQWRAANDDSSKELIANRDTLLRMFYDVVTEQSIIFIDPAHYQHSVIWCNEDATSVRWTEGPTLGHRLQIGSGDGIEDDEGNPAGSPYLRISGNVRRLEEGKWDFAVGAFGSAAVPGSSRNEQVWLMPDDPIDIDTFMGHNLTIGGYKLKGDQHQLQLKWTGPTLEGKVSFQEATGPDTWCHVKVEDGVLTEVLLTEQTEPVCSLAWTPTRTAPGVQIDEPRPQDPCLDGPLPVQEIQGFADVVSVERVGPEFDIGETAWLSATLSGDLSSQLYATGDVAWSTPGNAQTQSDTYATAGLLEGEVTETLVAKDFDFTGENFPAGSEVLGVEIRFEALGSPSATFQDFSIKIGKTLVGTAPEGTEQSSGGGSYPTTDTDAYGTYASASELHGLTLSISDVQSASFGVGIQVLRTNDLNGGTETVSIDHVQVKIHYKFPAIKVTDKLGLQDNVQILGNRTASPEDTATLSDSVTVEKFNELERGVEDNLGMDASDPPGTAKI